MNIRNSIRKFKIKKLLMTFRFSILGKKAAGSVSLANYFFFHRASSQTSYLLAKLRHLEVSPELYFHFKVGYILFNGFS